MLWWSIHRILKEKVNKPKYLILENVDRLLKSPSTQRGRDFAIMLKCLGDLGYAVEWRVINAAEYGMPQRRRRVFIIGMHKSAGVYDSFLKEQLLENSIFNTAFPASYKKTMSFELKESLEDISKAFNKGEKLSPFLNSGLYTNCLLYTSPSPRDS